MTVKEILTPLIQQELRKYEQSGHKIRLKTQQNNRIGYTVGCAAVGALLFPLLPITAIVYYFLMRSTNPVDTILSVAKRKPDTPIDEIIAQEMILK